MEIIGQPEIINALADFRRKFAATKLVTKSELTAALKLICQLDSIESARPGNDGAVGNTIEDLLGVPENNLPIPNAAEWELKGQRLGTTSLVSLFHLDPSPRSAKLIVTSLLPNYGWQHKQAGLKYAATEKSFRQTINGLNRTDRGFGLVVDYVNRKVEISFDAQSIHQKHAGWKESVLANVGLEELNPQPYWGFDDLCHKAGTKLHNCFFLLAEARKMGGKEFFKYQSVLMLQKFSLDKFIEGIEKGLVYVDFDARSGHNHGTKFRIRRDRLPEFYEVATVVV